LCNLSHSPGSRKRELGSLRSCKPPRRSSKTTTRIPINDCKHQLFPVTNSSCNRIAHRQHPNILERGSTTYLIPTLLRPIDFLKKVATQTIQPTNTHTHIYLHNGTAAANRRIPKNRRLTEIMTGSNTPTTTGKPKVRQGERVPHGQV